MHRNHRRGKVPRRYESPNRSLKIKDSSDVDQDQSLIRPRSKKSVANRCCYVKPEKRDFGQSYGHEFYSPPHVYYGGGGFTEDVSIGSPDQYRSLLHEQYGFEPIIPESITQFNGLKKMLGVGKNKIDISSQYVDLAGSPAEYVETSDGSQWQYMDTIDDLDKLIMNETDMPMLQCSTKHMFISDVPRVKIIAEKFSKYKKNNLELRRLDEKVVCLEYDVFDHPTCDNTVKPVQRMRAFFSIKPKFDNDASIPILPSSIKHNFNILDEDLKKLTEKEIEIIDGKIEENSTYLEDLKRILQRKHIIQAKKNKTSLDLQSLYEMARRDGTHLGCEYSESNLLSKAELQEVKDLILQRCASSVHGISRRKIKKKEKYSSMNVGVTSDSIVADLFEEDAKRNVYQ